MPEPANTAALHELRRRFFKEALLADTAACAADWKEGAQDLLQRLAFQQRWLLDRRAGLCPGWALATSLVREDIRKRELTEARQRAARKAASIRFTFREEQIVQGVSVTKQDDGKLDPENESILCRGLQAQIADLIEQISDLWLLQHSSPA
jgi:hypothetical protein